MLLAELVTDPEEQFALNCMVTLLEQYSKPEHRAIVQLLLDGFRVGLGGCVYEEKRMLQ